MARESVNIEELTRVDPAQLIQELTQENAQLRLEMMAQKSVINKLIAKIQQLDGVEDESPDGAF